RRPVRALRRAHRGRAARDGAPRRALSLALARVARIRLARSAALRGPRAADARLPALRDALGRGGLSARDARPALRRGAPAPRLGARSARGATARPGGLSARSRPRSDLPRPARVPDPPAHVRAERSPGSRAAPAARLVPEPR